MNPTITILERSILESLSRSPKGLHQLQEDLKLEIGLIIELIQSLVSKKLIQVASDNTYAIPENLAQELIAGLKSFDLKKAEVNLIIRSTLEQREMSDELSFKLKKVNLSEFDLKILQQKLKDIDSFLEQRNQKDGKTVSQNIIFWGVTDYENVYNHIRTNY